MGLLDSILGSVVGSMQGAGSTQEGAQSTGGALMQMAMKMLTEPGENGQSGLANMVTKFKEGGFANLADSWVGTGENLPVSAEQVSQVLGSGKLGEIASQLGISSEDVSGGLSKLLPELINQATPEGQIPESHDFISQALGALLKR